MLERDTVTLEDVAREPFIMLTVDEAAYTALRYWNETPFAGRAAAHPSVEAVRSMVANGSGVAVLSDMVYRPWSLEGRRIETIQPGSDSAHERGLAWRKGARDIAGDAGGARVFPACLYGAAGRPGLIMSNSSYSKSMPLRKIARSHPAHRRIWHAPTGCSLSDFAYTDAGRIRCARAYP